MCGIVGYSSTTCYKLSLQSSMEAMVYRGPDSRGHKSVEVGERHIGLGHVRLKVIDLDDRSSQPFVTNSGNSLIVFNGEVYNFLSLRALLPEHQWKTSSDTEVIAELLEAYGNSIVERFNGIFAIARLCLNSGSLTLYRDPLGVKPLYYSFRDGELFFASEIKSLIHFPVDKKISHADLLESMNFGYLHEPNTGFEHIKKVFPGGILVSDGSDIVESTFSYQPDNPDFSEKKIHEALSRQTISDVPLGTFFSGGVDSSVIASQVASDLLYINSRLGEDNNAEENYVKKLSTLFKRKLLIVNLPQEENFEKIINVVDQVVDGVEEPISDLTYIVSQDLAALAKENGFTVMLSGMGADELFGGYLRYYIIKYWFIFNPLFRFYLLISRFKRGASKHKSDRIYNYLTESSSLRKYARLVSYFSSAEIQECIGIDNFDFLDAKVFDRLHDLTPVNIRNNAYLSMRFLEMKGFLSHNLTVADKSSMKESVELRVPFLDLELLTGWLGSENNSPNIQNLGKKPLLQLLRKFIDFKWSPFSKTGFNPPVSKFFEMIDRKTVDDIIFTEHMLQFFSEAGLTKVLNECFNAEIVNYHKIWQLVFLARWLKRWSNDLNAAQ